MATFGPEPEPELHKWLREHGESTGRSDLHLVVTEGGKEIKIPVSRGILAVTSALVRDLPDAEDVPIIGDHTASTVVAFCKLCYPFNAVPSFGLHDIERLTRFAHWMGAPDVYDLLCGQLTTFLDSYEKTFYNLYTSPPHPVIYRAIFAMKDAGKEIQLTQYLIMYFPDWYMSLTEAAQVPYYKYSLPLFIDFMTEYEKLKNAYQSCHSPTAFKEASAKHLALSRYLLSFYTRAYGPGA